MLRKDIHFFYLYDNSVYVYFYKQKCLTYWPFDKRDITFRIHREGYGFNIFIYTILLKTSLSWILALGLYLWNKCIEMIYTANGFMTWVSSTNQHFLVWSVLDSLTQGRKPFLLSLALPWISPQLMGQDSLHHIQTVYFPLSVGDFAEGVVAKDDPSHSTLLGSKHATKSWPKIIQQLKLTAKWTFLYSGWEDWAEIWNVYLMIPYFAVWWNKKTWLLEEYFSLI